MATSNIVRPRAKWVELLEAVYAPAEDAETWANGVALSALDLFRCDDAINLTVVHHDEMCMGAEIQAVGAGRRGAVLAAGTAGDIRQIGPVALRTFFYPPAMVNTHSELERILTGEQREVLRSSRMVGMKDALGVVVHPEPGTILVLSCALDREMTPTWRERMHLSRLGLHLESAYRLRRRPEVVKGTLSANGRFIPSRGDVEAARLGEVFGQQVRHIETSLSRQGRADPEAALSLWTALVGGQWSLIARNDASGERRYLVVENSPRSNELRALSTRELTVLSMAARGLSTKLIAYGLGLSPATVSETLANAASKVGLSTHVELLRLAAILAHDPRGQSLPSTLTSAEMEVLALLREGLSNEQIARRRSRSVRTIANQVASLLRKTGGISRRSLLTLTPEVIEPNDPSDPERG